MRVVTTLYLNGGRSLFSSKRPLTRLVLFLFVLATIALVSCGTRGSDANWPGLSTDGENVYAAYGKRVIAYNVADQRQMWLFPAEASRALLYAAPSANEDGRVIFGDYGTSGGMLDPKITTVIHAVENGTGSPPATIWINNTAVSGKTVAPALQVDDTVYVGTNDSTFVALDAVNGTEIWRFEGAAEPVWGVPVYQDDTVFITSIDGMVYALDANSGAKKWEFPLEGAIAGGAVLNDNMLYVADFAAHIHALSTATGEEQWVIMADGSTWATPAYADGSVFFTDINGTIYAIDGQTGDKLWRQTMPYPLHTSPLAQDGVVYVVGGPEGKATEGMISAYEADSGDLIWQKIVTAPLTSTPVIVDDAVVTIKQAEAVYSLVAFDIETGTEKWAYVLPK